ncbi:hypothetical protein [Shewanella waksmanii]|uniref:hypothetical protein n=1 Tax=Shewanella waksmanii TaxID=213783 RepID=UPI003735EA12
MTVFWRLPKAITTVFMVSIIVMGFMSPSYAAEQFVFPEQGQSTEQQQSDEASCDAWATGQSGYDPSQPVTASANNTDVSAQGSERGSGMRGAMAGAAAGAAIAELGDDDRSDAAQNGAWIGAVAARRQSRRANQQQIEQQAAAQQQAQAQAVAANEQGNDDFLRARAACLGAKGYSVK